MLNKRLPESENSRERMATEKILVLKKLAGAILLSYINNANKAVGLYNTGFDIGQAWKLWNVHLRTFYHISCKLMNIWCILRWVVC
jgi:hypothetical protein